MKVQNIIYFTDEYILIYNKKYKKILKEKIDKNIILYGRIINVNKFLKEFENVLAKYKLNNNIFGEKINIIVNSSLNNTETNIIKEIFLSLNYRNVSITKENTYFNLDKYSAYLSVFDNYVTLNILDEYKDEKIYLIPNYYFENDADLMKYIKYIIKNKNLYLLGCGDKLKYIFNNFENIYFNKTYIFCENENYLINKAKV